MLVENPIGMTPCNVVMLETSVVTVIGRIPEHLDASTAAKIAQGIFDQSMLNKSAHVDPQGGTYDTEMFFREQLERHGFTVACGACRTKKKEPG